MEFHKISNKKIIWIQRKAVVSFILLIFALLMNFYREPLLGLKQGYAPHNLSFNFLFLFPCIFLSTILGLLAMGRIFKYWKNWPNLKKKFILLGLSFPVLTLWVIFIVRVFFP